jgi:hypothetical protein
MGGTERPGMEGASGHSPPERQAAYFENVRKRTYSGDGAGDLPGRRAGASEGRG